MRRNVHIEQFLSNSHDFVNENLKNFENVKFFNINEPRVIKKKNCSKDFTNKKNFITRVQKKIVNSTFRNFSKFEHVKINIQNVRDEACARNRERKNFLTAKKKRENITLAKKKRKNITTKEEITKKTREKQKSIDVSFI